MSIESHVNDLLAMVGKGQMLEAFEKYYAEDVVMQENNEPPRVGKKVNREFEIQFLGSIEAMHGGDVKNIAINEKTGVAMIQSWMDVTMKGAGRYQMEEVAVQQWKNGKIVHEKFYYNKG
jgi:hypothetical protein